MTQQTKKGQEGTAVEYTTRTRAVRKLQLSLGDFRRLCILKGIYPRDPKHKNRIAGAATNKKTVYLTKDIKFLAHEPLLAKFREQRAFYKRLSRYIGKRDWSKVRSLEENLKPEIKLDHLVRERYPSFADALRDLDDPLSMLALFSTLPRTEVKMHQAETALQCTKLLREFEAYVIATGGLKKSFISIKGIYYQAEVLGVPVTWVVPHEFTTPIPTNVDFKVMLTFLDFYLTLMRFVNYRLFTRLGWEYPSGKFISESDEFVLSGTLPPIENPDEIFPQGDHRLLSEAKVFISREAPRKAMSFVLQCMGATISVPAEEEQQQHPLLVKEDDPTITHQIVDRPSLPRMFVGRQYVQPQWAFDSLNAGSLLDMTSYRMGAPLPSHLSPFVTAQDDEGEDEATEPEEEQASTEDLTLKKSKKSERKAQKELAISMLSNKRHKLYQKMQLSRQKRANEKKTLQTKRTAAAAVAAAAKSSSASTA